MAKSGAAEGSVFDGRRMAEEERKKELRRLVEAIMEDDLGREEVYVDAERVIAALRELRVCAGRGLPGGKSSPATSGQERKQEKPAEDSTVEIDSGMAAPAKVPVPKHFLCPLSSAIMRDPVVVSSGEIEGTWDCVERVGHRILIFTTWVPRSPELLLLCADAHRQQPRSRLNLLVERGAHGPDAGPG
ncbi:hypothetical protein AXF42_Ash020255 [Apostasia shenzhenica]|uniref:U-box domain-containing protein n=1 Tax=Apostasia shenzhenica TaxID=1088818 RepID=A0A2I0AVS6_9ASPA|nr:hypothetical protein AXF42_Ash020255 [Apostasia shenzhenica]